jgi:hypothetical protein
MDQGMLSKVVALRDEAFKTLKALDDAVVSLGGASGMGAGVSAASDTASGSGVARANGETVRRPDRPPSQSSAAGMILRERGEPMTGVDLMSRLPAKGVMLGGKPASRKINFTSAMSKSGKYRSVRRGGNYYWWFNDEALPPGWNEEAPDLLSKEGSDASLMSNQEGGEANATATN